MLLLSHSVHLSKSQAHPDTQSEDIDSFLMVRAVNNLWLLRLFKIHYSLLIFANIVWNFCTLHKRAWPIIFFCHIVYVQLKNQGKGLKVFVFVFYPLEEFGSVIYCLKDLFLDYKTVLALCVLFMERLTTDSISLIGPFRHSISSRFSFGKSYIYIYVCIYIYIF